MTRIAIDVPSTYTVAAALRRAEGHLDDIGGDLRRQWSRLDGRWEGRNKHRVESQVNSAVAGVQALSRELYEIGLKLEHITRRFETADQTSGLELIVVAWHSLTNAYLIETNSEQDAPHARVYIMNGINSQAGYYVDEYGRIVPFPNAKSEELAKLLKDNGTGFEATATPAIYNTNWQGAVPFLTPVAALLTGIPGEVLKPLLNIEASVANTLIGVTQVAGEYLLGENGYYTNQTYDWIADDLKNNPLLPGQKIVLVGHSGGGAPASNLAGMIEKRLGYDVAGVVTLGSPVANTDNARQYAESVVNIRDSQDLFGTPIIRSNESRQNPLLGGFLADLANRDQIPNVTYRETGHMQWWERLRIWKTPDAHGSYFTSVEVGDLMREQFLN